MSPAPAGSPRSGEEIQAALQGFVTRWQSYTGTERSEAQTFLNELFECYGTSRIDVGAKFEDFQASASGSGFMDLHWPEVVIVEMKRPSRSIVQSAQDQVMRYWRESAVESLDQPAARYVIVCSFQRFEIWEPGRFPMRPRLTFEIEELPERYQALAFLAAPTLVPSFLEHHRALTKEAAASVALLYQSLKDRSAAPIDEVQRFTMHDFSMGLIQSSVHVAWAWAQSSTLETRLRYTPSSVFETFPWAGAFATPEQRERVAEACHRLLERRSEICVSEQIGLTTLYNQVDDGAYVDLQRLHRALDEAVADCYGWPRSIAQDDAELVRRLTALNRQIVEGEVSYEPFAYLDTPAPVEANARE